MADSKPMNSPRETSATRLRNKGIRFLCWMLRWCARPDVCFAVVMVTSVSYHPKDSCMITSSVDGTIRVWKT
ncbi:hypothetical protein RJ640_012537 [Escallonia rubra]|uniref:Uncharacterized protein n=1 Tax=Escallonia rubra TaxID=112253 RepID=A0AA88S1T4_9ASTE|nr:hypothetical protein RJ640_012537 [Escallonia rubra]